LSALGEAERDVVEQPGDDELGEEAPSAIEQLRGGHFDDVPCD